MASTYGRFERPGEFDSNGKPVVVVLQADEDNRALYEGKGFTFVGYAPAPGIAAAGPRDIDRNDDGTPEGPDGSTHERHDYEVTPDADIAPPVPWGITMETPDTTHATEDAVKDARLKKGDLMTPKEEMARLEELASNDGRPAALHGATDAYADDDPALRPQDTPNAPARGSVSGDVTRADQNRQLAARQAVAERTAKALPEVGSDKPAAKKGS